MFETFIEELFYTTNNDTRDVEDEKSDLYTRALVSVIKELVPNWNTDIENKLYSLAVGGARVSEVIGYRKGLRFAFQLMTEVFHKPPRSYMDWENDIKKIIS